ncbi:PAP2 family protein [hydrothermal vent metagenome]|uniref:PAP2 family protein n=1 Tax=hydrothermal vent metagenome TaxID=652676 RepID=A0A1W1C065_9ZZZZ
MNINRQILFTLLILIGSVLFFGVSDIDVKVQDLFYNFQTHSWILDSHKQPYKFLFYDGLKRLLIAIGIILLLLLLFFWKKDFLQPYKRGLLIVILSAIVVPVVVGGLKKETNMPCPKDEVHYGGLYPRTAVWQPYPLTFKKEHPTTRCWPAGHASGGFALMSLFFLFRTKKNKIIALLGGIATGWIMGLYKMIIGDHFFSHTFITMVLAWLLILLIVKLIDHYFPENDSTPQHK